MRARSRIIRRLVVTAKRQGKSYRVVAREFDLPIGTVKRWCSTTHGTPNCEEKNPQYGTLPAGAWMQSIYHDSAHFITAGHAACENAQNGVHALGGVVWFPHDGNLRKCLRCMNQLSDPPQSHRAAQSWKVTRVLHDLKKHGWTHVDVCSQPTNSAE